MQAKHVKSKSQIVFDDVQVQYKSLYLDTLGADAVRRSFADAVVHHASSSCLPVEGYAHGMGTADISGASPAVHSLTKAAAARHQAEKQAVRNRPDETPPAAAAAVDSCSNAADVDAGMRPRVRHPQTVNRPDLTHSTLDIDGAQPQPRNTFRRARNTNPLNPCYKLSDSPALPLPCGPALADKCLGDPLDVADIPGASCKPQRPCSRPGQLDVSDIEGAYAAWRPHHRQQSAAQPRAAGLDVHDINAYMARFVPAARPTAAKGHPDGPRLEARVRPRHSPALMDNSLRTLDIEGTRAVPASMRAGARQPHNHTTCVADIEGTAPADRDKAHLKFERKKAAAAALLADQAAAQAVLSGLELSPQDVAALWGNCSKRDKDGSGYLTAQELEGAMQAAQLQLPAADAQRLLAALQDNAGLLDYRKLTRQLKGRASRPGSAKQQLSSGAQQEQPQLQVQQQHYEQQQQQHGPAMPCSAMVPASVAVAVPQPSDASSTAAAAAEHQLTRDSGDSSAGLQAAVATHGAEQSTGAVCSVENTVDGALQRQQRARPKTAPSRACGASGHQHAAVAGSSGEHGYKGVSHWFGGSSRDTTVAEGVARLRPGQAARLVSGMQPGTGSAATDGSAAASHGNRPSSSCRARSSTQQQRQQVLLCNAPAAAAHAAAGCAFDVVPGWMVGGDPMHGTFKVVQPFGEAANMAVAEAAAATPAAAAAAAALSKRPGSAVTQRHVSSNSGGGSYSPAPERVATVHKRPASAGPCCAGGSRSSGVAVVSPAAMKVVGCRWGADGAAGVLGVPGGSGSCITSQWLCTGVVDGEGCEQQRAWQRNARPGSAAAAVRQRPASASAQSRVVHSSSSSCRTSAQPSCPAQQRASRQGTAGAAVAASATAVSAGGGAGQLGAVGRPMGRPSSCLPHSVSSSVGLAEQRRLAESTRQDLTAVRLLR